MQLQHLRGLFEFDALDLQKVLQSEDQVSLIGCFQSEA